MLPPAYQSSNHAVYICTALSQLWYIYILYTYCVLCSKTYVILSKISLTNTRGMMQEKPQPSIRHIQATGRAALKLGTTTIAWPRGNAHALIQANRQRRVNYAAIGAIIATAIRWTGKLASRKKHLMRDVMSPEKKKSSIMRQTRASRNRVFL